MKKLLVCVLTIIAIFGVAMVMPNFEEHEALAENVATVTPSTAAVPSQATETETLPPSNSVVVNVHGRVFVYNGNVIDENANIPEEVKNGLNLQGDVTVNTTP